MSNNNEMTVSEASDFLEVTTRTVINYVKSREIEGIKVGKSWFLNKASVHGFKLRYNVSDSRQQTADSRQQTADSRQQTTDNRARCLFKI